MHAVRERPAPLIIAHRGASGYRPEHTRSAFMLAIEQGADAIEIDLVVSSDGQLVIRHENEISSTTDIAGHPQFADRRTTKSVDGVRHTGWFTENFTWSELAQLRSVERLTDIRAENEKFDGAEPILRFTEFLRLLDDSRARPSAGGAQTSARAVIPVIEIKHAQYFEQLGFDLADLVMADLRSSGWLERTERGERIVVESFELGPLDRLRSAGLRAELVFLLESIGAPADDSRSYDWYRSDAGLDALVGRVDGVSLAKRDLLADVGTGIGTVTGADTDTGIVDRAHGRGFDVYVWTLRPENRFLGRAYRSGRSASEWGRWREEWQRIIQTGVDGIFVDHPDLAVSLRNRQ